MFRQHIIKAVAFVLIGLGLLSLAGPVMIPKNNDPGSGMHQPGARAIMVEPENSIDIIFAGDSESYTSISPKLIQKKYGFTSYVCGTSGQRMYVTYELLREALKKQTPKAVVIETNCIFTPRGWIYDFWQLADYKLGKLFPAIDYHDRWKILALSDFYTQPSYTWASPQRGYRRKVGARPYEGGRYMVKSKKREQIRPIQNYYLDKIADLCDEKGIPVVFFSVPSPDNWTYEKHNEIQSYAKEHGYTFWDLNLKAAKLKINWKKDTYDGGDHLNNKGMKKISLYMGKKLKKKFHLAG